MTKCERHVTFQGQQVVCNLPLDHPPPHRAGVFVWYENGQPRSIFDPLT